MRQAATQSIEFVNATCGGVERWSETSEAGEVHLCMKQHLLPQTLITVSKQTKALQTHSVNPILLPLFLIICDCTGET